MKILVAAHKEFEQIAEKNTYIPVQAGTSCSQTKIKSFFYDNSSSDNISEKNPYYCELTVQYWGWKNLNNVDVIGLVHYRRYFSDIGLNVSSKADAILSAKKIYKILKTKKIIIPPSYYKPLNGNARLIEGAPKSNSNPWVVIEKIIEDDYPEMRDSFHKVVYGKKMFFGNMFITTKDYFDSYSKWLFDVLGKFDNQYEALNYKRSLRMDGFLSELLLNVWSDFIFKENEKYISPIINTELNIKKQLNMGPHWWFIKKHHFKEYLKYCVKKILFMVKGCSK